VGGDQAKRRSGRGVGYVCAAGDAAFQRRGQSPGGRRGAPILRGVGEASTQICVRVRLFASYREAAGSGHLELPLEQGAHLSELVELLAARVPALRTSRGLVAVNQTYVTDDPVLADRDEVAFIPPVSGGV